MFNSVSKKNSEALDLEIKRLTDTLAEIDPEDEGYAKVSENLLKLLRTRSEGPKRDIDPNILITAGTSLLSILIILKYEELGVISSRAMNLIAKPRM